LNQTDRSAGHQFPGIANNLLPEQIYRACDPLSGPFTCASRSTPPTPRNLVGLILPGPAVPAVRTDEIVYVDGTVEGDG